MSNVIISLTSHTKERLKNVGYFLYHSIFKYHYDYVKVVLTLYKDDVQNIPDDLREMIDNGMIELVVAEENLRCHLKYFYCMKKYREIPIITIDDDSIYPKEMIPDFLKNAEKYKGVIIGRSGVILQKGISYVKCESVNYRVEKTRWNTRFFDDVRDDLSLEGYGGIYYPANILDVNDSMIEEIKKFSRADDIYLNVIENRKGIKRVVCKYDYNKLIMCTKGFDAISTKQDNVLMINNLLKQFEKDLYK